MKSFEAIANPTARMVLELLSCKATQRAKYFCTGMLDIAKYGHYALNVPLYTHFTSPIRRYADILVHRQLESVLQGGSEWKDPIVVVETNYVFIGDPKFTMDRDAVAKIAQQCNMYVAAFSMFDCLLNIFLVNAILRNWHKSSPSTSSSVSSSRT